MHRTNTTHRSPHHKSQKTSTASRVNTKRRSYSTLNSIISKRHSTIGSPSSNHVELPYERKVAYSRASQIKPPAIGSRRSFSTSHPPQSPHHIAFHRSLKEAPVHRDVAPDIPLQMHDYLAKPFTYQYQQRHQPNPNRVSMLGFDRVKSRTTTTYKIDNHASPIHQPLRTFKSQPKRPKDFYSANYGQKERTQERWIDMKPPESDLVGNARFLQYYGFQKSVFGHDVQHDDISRQNYGKSDTLKGPSPWVRIKDTFNYYKPGGVKSRIKRRGMNRLFDKKLAIALRYVAVVFLFEFAGEEWAVNTMGLLALCFLLSFIALPLVLLYIIYKFIKRVYKKYAFPKKLQLLYERYGGLDEEDKWPDMLAPFKAKKAGDAEKMAIQDASSRGPKGMIDLMLDTIKMQQDELRKNRDVLMLEIHREEHELMRLIKSYKRLKIFKFDEENIQEQDKVIQEQREDLKQLYEDLREIDEQGAELHNSFESLQMHLHNAVYDSVEDINHPVVKEIMKNEVIEIAMGRGLPEQQTFVHPDRKEAAFNLLAAKQKDLIDGKKDMETIREELESEAPYLFVRPRRRLPRLSAETFDNVNPYGIDERLLDPLFDDRQEAELKRVTARDYAKTFDKKDDKFNRIAKKVKEEKNLEQQKEEEQQNELSPSELRRLGDAIHQTYDDIRTQAQKQLWWPFKSKTQPNADNQDKNDTSNKYLDSHGKEITREQYLKLQEEADLQFVAQIEKEFSYQYNLEQKQKREQEEKERIDAELAKKQKKKWFGKDKSKSNSTATPFGPDVPPPSAPRDHQQDHDPSSAPDNTTERFHAIPNHLFGFNMKLATAGLDDDGKPSFDPNSPMNAKQAEAARIAFGEKIVIDEDLIDHSKLDVDDIIKIKAKPKFWSGTMFHGRTKDDIPDRDKDTLSTMTFKETIQQRATEAKLTAKSKLSAVIPWFEDTEPNKWDVTRDDAFDDITKYDLNKADIDKLEELAGKYTSGVSKRWS